MALLMRRDTLLFLGATILFHVANAGALPALGQKLDTLAHETADAGRAPVLFFGQPLMGVVGISMCIIVSQLAMIPVAIASKRLVSPDRLGLRLTLLLSYSTAPVRQCINAASSMPFVLLSAQLLDAAGDGCLGVVSVIVIEHLARGTPHFAFMQSVGTSCKGVGSAISSTLIATLVDHAGFGAAFSAAAIIAVSPIVVTLAMRDPGTGSALDNPLNAYYARRLGWIVLTVLLLCGSCFAMITAWYFHLKLDKLSMPLAILISWLIAGGEYMLQVPANRIGAYKAGLTPAALRGIAELASIVAFLIFQALVLDQPILPNHIIGFGIVFVGVLVVLGGPWGAPVCTAGRHSLGYPLV